MVREVLEGVSSPNGTVDQTAGPAANGIRSAFVISLDKGQLEQDVIAAVAGSDGDVVDVVVRGRLPAVADQEVVDRRAVTQPYRQVDVTMFASHLSDPEVDCPSPEEPVVVPPMFERWRD